MVDSAFEFEYKHEYHVVVFYCEIEKFVFATKTTYRNTYTIHFSQTCFQYRHKSKIEKVDKMILSQMIVTVVLNLFIAYDDYESN